MTHSELVERAMRWLSGRRCAPIFNDCASCSEIPDAIGWSSSFKHCGSFVIECKASRSDFYADKKKRFHWIQPEHQGQYRNEYRFTRFSAKEAEQQGLITEEIPRMGNYRYYLCPPGIITEQMLTEHADCHGLLYAEPRRIKVIREAPRRDNVNYEAEIRYLRFCIINGKKPFTGDTQEQPQMKLIEGRDPEVCEPCNTNL